MINVSNDFKNRMEEHRDFKNYAEITFSDGNKITLDSSQFLARNNVITDGAGVSSFPVGIAVQKYVKFEILNDAEQYKNYGFLGAKIRLYTDFRLDEIDPWIGKNLLPNSSTQLVLLLNGAQATFEQNIAVPEWQAKDAIRVAGTADSEKSLFAILSAGKLATANTHYTYSIFIKNNSKNNLKIANNIGSNSTIEAGNTEKLIIHGIGNGSSYLQFVFNIESGKEDFDFVYWHPKIEEGDIDDPIYSIAPEDVRTERIEKGTYTVVTPETYGETVMITAYDDMYKADKDYTTSLTFPQTAGAVLRDLCDTCDISLGSTKFPHDDFMIQNKPTGKCREVIGNIAMIACGNARIDARNKLQIMTYHFQWDYQANVVAGENLIYNTYIPTELLPKNNNYNFAAFDFTVGKLKKGQTYSLSADIEVTAGSFSELSLFLSDSAYLAQSEIKKLPIIDGHITGTIKATGENAENLLIYAGVVGETAGNGVKISKLKFEEGNESTPWIPAQSDGAEPYFLLDEFTAPKIEYNDTVITGFKTVIKGETSDDDREVLQGTDTYVITVQNPLIEGQEQTVLSWLLEKIGNIPFRPFSGDAISNPLIEFMDLAKVQDRRGNQYNTFVTDVNFLMPGYTSLKNSTPSMARSAVSYPSAEAKVEQRARKLVEAEKTAREQAIDQLRKALGEASGMYNTDVLQPDGSTIRYLHDKPTLAESKNIIKITAESIGISNDGGKSYPYGLTLNGETVTRLLYAEGIDADYINAGSITVKDEEGNIIFSADMNSKTVRIGGMLVEKNLLTNEFSIFNYPNFTEADVRRCLDAASGLIELTPEEFAKYDMNKDGRLTSVDALMIGQIVEGIVPANGKIVMRVGSGVTNWDRNFETELYDKDGNFLSGTSIGATGVRINNSKIFDFVIEQGVIEDWAYRRWYSGTAECWKVFDFYNSNPIKLSKIENGYQYNSDGDTKSTHKMQLPPDLFTEASIPLFTVNGDQCLVSVASQSATMISPRYWSPYNETVNAYVRTYVIGKWKEET